MTNTAKPTRWLIEWPLAGGSKNWEVVEDERHARQIGQRHERSTVEPLFAQAIDVKRHTFQVPVDHEAIRDANGRATAEVRPIFGHCFDESGSSPGFGAAVPEVDIVVTGVDLARHHSVSWPPTSFQSRVQPWLLACFGEMIAGDREERNHRFLEEALELVQSLGCTAHEAHQLVDYVYGRAIGEPYQEVGGTMVTLAALCWANDLDMHQAGETELARIWTKVEAIRAKQASKPKHSPLPGPTSSAENPPPVSNKILEALSNVGSMSTEGDDSVTLRFSDVKAANTFVFSLAATVLFGDDPAKAQSPQTGSQLGGIRISGWINEDELPASYPYDVMFQHSKVDGVRLFPVFAPEETSSPIGTNKLGQTAIERAQSDFMEFLAQDGYLDTDRCLEPKSAAYIQTLLDKLCEAARQDLRLELAATIREGISAVADARQAAKDSPTSHVMGSCIRCGGVEQLPADAATCAICVEAIRTGSEPNGADRSPKEAKDSPTTHVTGIPAGWKLVPVEPTDAMIEAGRMARMNIQGGYGGPGGWEAMLTAAPTPPASHVGGSEARHGGYDILVEEGGGTWVTEKDFPGNLAGSLPIKRYSIFHDENNKPTLIARDNGRVCLFEDVVGLLSEIAWHNADVESQKAHGLDIEPGELAKP